MQIDFREMHFRFLVHRLRQIPSIRKIHIHRKEQFSPVEYSQKCIAKNEINILAAANEIKNGRQNAIMVLLVDCPKDGTSILFTHRAAKMKNHANEISLPGGAMEQGESIEIAALRETEEEIGLDRREMEIWGQLPSIPMPKNEGKTTPILCRFIGDPASFESKLRPQANEVQGIFLVSIDELIKNIHFTAFRVPGRFKHGLPMYYKMPAFIVNEFKVLCPSKNEKYLPNRRRIWGLTAICVHEMLLSILPLKDKIKQK